MPYRPRLWPPILSAGLLLLAYWPLNGYLLAFIAPAPLLWELSRRRGWRAWRAGLSYGFVFMVGQFWWLLHLTQRWVGSDTLGFVPIFLGSFLSALFWFAPMAWLISKCWALEKPWLIPLVWSGAEIVRGTCPTLAYPWGLLGSTLSEATPLIQLAWFGTVFGVSAWALLPSVITASLLSGRSLQRATHLGYAFGILALLSLARFFWPVHGQEIVVVAGQPGVDWAFDKRYEQYQKDHQLHLEHIGDITADAANRQARLLVLPEGANGNSRFPIQPDFPLDARVPTLFGSHRSVGPGETYQSAILAENGGYTWADKTRLVIFGEYVPGRNILPFLDKFDLPSGDVREAARPANLRSGDLRIAPLVCFEGLFPDVTFSHTYIGADLVAVMSIDDWFEGTSAMEQLRSGSIFRAIEAGAPVIRAAQTGYSMVIDQRGAVLAQAPLDEMASVPAKVKVKEGGPSLLQPAFMLLALLSLVYVGASKVKPKADEDRVDEPEPEGP